MMVPSSGFLLVIIGVAFIVIHAGPANHARCPENQEYKTCGSACPANCSHPRPPLCGEKCVSGCFCKEGFLAIDSGECIKEQICRDCTGNKIYTTCGSACPANCSHPKPRGCIKKCVEGCFCKEGFLAIDSGECIKEQLCKDCTGNKIYTTCGSACPANCSHPEPRACIKKCAKGCFCNEGFLATASGECIKEQLCKDCTGNRTYTTCGSACPTTCSNRSRRCIALCVPGCFCKPGYILHNEGDKTRCILIKDCPRVK